MKEKVTIDVNLQNEQSNMYMELFNIGNVYLVNQALVQIHFVTMVFYVYPLSASLNTVESVMLHALGSKQSSLEFNVMGNYANEIIIYRPCTSSYVRCQL